MLTFLFLVFYWVICSVPFAMLGIPTEVSLVLGAILGFLIAKWMVKSPGSKSSYDATVQQPVQKYGSSRFASDDGDGIDDMTMMDMTDGSIDGDFGFFD